MAELAQPMHAFDARQAARRHDLRPPRARGRALSRAEREEYTLGPSNLVIADAGGPIALAGVIGGLDSAIGDQTTRIVLESANFQAVQRAQEPPSAHQAAHRCVHALRESAGSGQHGARPGARGRTAARKVSPGIRMVGGLADQRKRVRASAADRPARGLAGCASWAATVAPAEVRGILETARIRRARSRSRGVFSVTVPSWRATKDISIKDDLVEEVGRMVGYDSITPHGAAGRHRAVRPSNPSAQVPARRARHVRGRRASPRSTTIRSSARRQVRAFGFDPGGARRASPIRSPPTRRCMRTSLLPGIWNNILENSKHSRIVPPVRDRPGDSQAAPRALAATKIPHLVAAIYDRAGRWRRRPVRNQARGGVPDARRAGMRPREARPFEHPARAADLVWKGETAGTHVRTASLAGGSRARGGAGSGPARGPAAERGREEVSRPSAGIPSSAFDLSVVAGLREHAGNLEAADRLVRRAAAGIRASSCGSTPARRSKKERRASRSASRWGRPERTLSSEESGRHPRAHHRRHARPGLRTAGVSTRRAKLGGWAPRQRDSSRWCGGEVSGRRITFCSEACVHEWKLRTDPGYLRAQVFERDRGVRHGYRGAAAGQAQAGLRRRCSFIRSGRFAFSSDSSGRALLLLAGPRQPLPGLGQSGRQRLLGQRPDDRVDHPAQPRRHVARQRNGLALHVYAAVALLETPE